MRRKAVEKAELERNVDDDTDSRKVYEDNKMRGMLHMVDGLLQGFEEELGIGSDGNGRFYMRMIGSIDTHVMLRQMGVKGGPESNQELVHEIGFWEKGLVMEECDYINPSDIEAGHIRWRGKEVPHFLALTAFKTVGGKIVGIREDDEIVGYRPLLPSQKADGETQGKPIIVHADWVKYIRVRFPGKKADGIITYMMARRNELINTPYAGTSNYSLPRMLWDKMSDQPANAEQKMALLMHAMNKRHTSKISAVHDFYQAIVPQRSQHGIDQHRPRDLVAETFAGKSFFDKDNSLLHWAPKLDGDTTDAD